MSILDDYQLEADFAREQNVDQRTITRYRNAPDGLPFVKFGGRVYIHVPGAREWLARRVVHRNPTAAS